MHLQSSPLQPATFDTFLQNSWLFCASALLVRWFVRDWAWCKAQVSGLEQPLPKYSMYSAYFVDLFVRVSNVKAIEMYKMFGYTVYRRVLSYYSGEEDAFDMRKAMARDRDKKSMVPLGRAITPDELEHD
eukprot:SM000353S13171  [mRNA]  locus=s353:46588:47344:- [translate_table: standard]